MNSGSKAPAPPNPYTTAAAQTGSNQSTAMFENLLNMQNQVTPYGSLTWQNTGNWTYTDPQTGKTVTVPRFTANSQLSPEQQALLNQQQQFDARYNQMALDQAAQIKDTLSKPFTYDPGVHEAWAGGLYDKLNKDSIARNQDELQQSLANRGLNYGTAAYDQGMRDFYEGNQRARDSFMLDSYNTGLNTALTIRNQPLKEGVALMGAGQITEPQWISGPQTGVANTDVAGLVNGGYANQLARQQQANAQSAGMWGALGQLGSAALGGWLASDARVKDVGETVGVDPDSGLPVRQWAYKGDGTLHATPLAQDVEQAYPDAVTEVDGVKQVNWRGIPGGEKFEQNIIDPRIYGQPGLSMESLPDGRMMRGDEMNVDPNDPMTSIRGALPPARYQETRARKGLSQLGARSVG